VGIELVLLLRLLYKGFDKTERADAEVRAKAQLDVSISQPISDRAAPLKSGNVRSFLDFLVPV